jgi:hypothetical protein
MITTILGPGILVIGLSALTNCNTVAMQDSTSSAAISQNIITGEAQQMQELLTQYQDQ